MKHPYTNGNHREEEESALKSMLFFMGAMASSFINGILSMFDDMEDDLENDGDEEDE